MWQGTLTTSADVTKLGWVAETRVGPQQGPHELQQREVQSPTQAFSVARKRTLSSLRPFCLKLCSSVTSAEGQGNLFPLIPVGGGSSPHSGCSLCCDFTWVPWIAVSYYDTHRRIMYHNNFKAHGVQWVRQGVNRRGRSLNTDNMMLIWAGYYFIFSLSKILLLWWNRWSLLQFYSLAPKSSSNNSSKWKKNQTT